MSAVSSATVCSVVCCMVAEVTETSESEGIVPISSNVWIKSSSGESLISDLCDLGLSLAEDGILGVVVPELLRDDCLELLEELPFLKTGPGCDKVLGLLTFLRDV